VEIIVFLPFCHQYSLNGKDIKAFLKAEQLKQILSTKGVFANRPRERPKNPGVTGKMLPPSKILKRHRLKAKDRLEVFLKAGPMLIHLLDEYERMVRPKVRIRMSINAGQLLSENEDLVSFRERRPTKRKLQLMSEVVLPSDIKFNERVPTHIMKEREDIKLYKDGFNEKFG
jgi:hypothetical protein